MSNPGADLIGQRVFDRYVVQKTLSEGAMAEVYVALDVVADRNVAVKVLKSSADPDSEARFRQEAAMLSRLQDPRTLKLYEFGPLASGQLCMVTELLRGRNVLEAIGAEGQLGPETVTRMLIDVCHALNEAHAAGVVHRDIKPANLFFHENLSGEVTTKLLDFGVAKLEDEAKIETRELIETRQGYAVGSLAYMPPEQAGMLSGPDGPVEADGRADLYSLGIVAFQCLTGELPFLGGQRTVLLKQRDAELPELEGSVELGFRWAPLEGIVRRLTAKSPDDRPASAAEVRGELERLLFAPPATDPPSSSSRTLGGRPGRSSEQKALDGGRGSSRRRMWMALPLGLVVAVGSVYALRNLQTVEKFSAHMGVGCGRKSPPKPFLAPALCEDERIFASLEAGDLSSFANASEARALEVPDPALMWNAALAHARDGRCDRARAALATAEDMCPNGRCVPIESTPRVEDEIEEHCTGHLPLQVSPVRASLTVEPLDQEGEPRTLSAADLDETRFPVGRYKVAASAPGYRGERVTVTVDADGNGAAARVLELESMKARRKRLVLAEFDSVNLHPSSAIPRLRKALIACANRILRAKPRPVRFSLAVIDDGASATTGNSRAAPEPLLECAERAVKSGGVTGKGLGRLQVSFEVEGG